MALIVEYGFNENTGSTTQDLSGNGLTATAVSTPQWYASGHNESGWGVMAGTPRGLSVPNASTFLTLTNWTAMAWALSPMNFGNPIFIIRVASGGIFSSDSITIKYRSDYMSGPNNLIYNIPLAQQTTTNFRHIAATYDGTTVKIFLDGVQVGSQTMGVSPPGVGNNLYLYDSSGDGWTDTSGYGIIDDVRIFDTAMTISEITYWMNTPASKMAPIMWVT